MTKDNFKDFRENAITLMKSEEYRDASLIWSAMITKGKEFYGGDDAFELAECYKYLGYCLCQDVIQRQEILVDDKNTKDNIEMIQEFIDENGELDT